jgi:hypothetical protein
MTPRSLRTGAAVCAVALAVAALSACGATAGSAVGGTPTSSAPITEERAVAYAHAVNLHAGDLVGFSSSGTEMEAPAPGPLALALIRCRGGVDPARRIAEVSSVEFSAGSAFYSKVLRSTVEVWPTPGLVARDNATSHSRRGRACLARFVERIRREVNRERKGRNQYGPFTITDVPNPVPRVSHSFITTINETRLLRGAIGAHVYRDLLGFISGAATVELEAVGFGHRVPAATEARALRLLLTRARQNAI